MQDFKDRRERFEGIKPENQNPHISGTYITSLYLMEERYGLKEDLKTNDTSFKDAIKSIETPDINPLSFVALTNVYKYVEVGSDNRKTGREIKKDLAVQYKLLADEINILEPEIIILQSREFEPVLNLGDWKGKLYLGPHPSYPGISPREYFEKLTEI